MDLQSPARQTTIRAYAEALLEIPFKHIKENLITPEELMYVFTAAALLVNKNFIDKKISLEALSSAEKIIKKVPNAKRKIKPN